MCRYTYKKVKEVCVWEGIFEHSHTYDINGKRVLYGSNSYTTYEKGDKITIPFGKIPRFIIAGNNYESIVHKIPSEDLIWKQEWISMDLYKDLSF